MNHHRALGLVIEPQHRQTTAVLRLPKVHFCGAHWRVRKVGIPAYAYGYNVNMLAKRRTRKRTHTYTLPFQAHHFGIGASGRRPLGI